MPTKIRACGKGDEYWPPRVIRKETQLLSNVQNGLSPFDFRPMEIPIYTRFLLGLSFSK